MDMPRRTRTLNATTPTTTSTAAIPAALLIERIAAEVRAGRWEKATAACRELAELQPRLATFAELTAEAAGRHDALATVARLLRLAAASDDVARKAA